MAFNLATSDFQLEMNNSKEKKRKIAFSTASVQTNSTADNSKWVVIDFAFMCEISTKAMYEGTKKKFVAKCVWSVCVRAALQYLGR